MQDDDITTLLDRAALAYTPDVAKALTSVQARVRRHRARRTVAGTIGLSVIVAAVSVLVALGGNGAKPVTTLRYLSIAPSTRLVAVSVPANGLSDVYFADRRQGIGMQQRCSLSPTADTTCTLIIERTHDGGASWRPAGPALHVTYPDSRESYPLLGFATNGKDGWIYGSKTFVTHNGGKSFVPGGPGGLVTSVSIVGGQTWALSRPCPPAVSGCLSTLYSTETGGGPWRALPRAPKLAYPYLQMIRSSGSDAFLTTQATGGILYATNDGGRSWARHQLPTLCAQLQHLAATSDHDLWDLCSGPAPDRSQAKALYHSVNGGRTWALVATTDAVTAPGVGALPLSGIVTLLTSVAPGDLWIALDDGPVLASTDGGRTWTWQRLPTSSAVTQLSFTDRRHGWALTSPAETVVRTSDGGARWITVDRP